jgi:uncharacterized protein with beta-barrel porin domain
MAIPMKAHLIRFTTLSTKNLQGTLAWLVTTLIFFNLLPKAWCADLFWQDDSTAPATAGSGTWGVGTNTGFGTWSSTSGTLTPWTDGNVAHFLGSGGPSVPPGGPTVTLGTPITAAGIDFDPGATLFTINTNGHTLTIDGPGIVNTSGKTQTISNDGAQSSTIFQNASTAGNALINNNGAVSGGGGGFTEFTQTSTAGNATITNNGGTVSSGGGGFTEFTQTSTASNAMITNNGGTTEFFNTSTASNAVITNNGGATTGATGFFNTSTAGSATITNNGSASGTTFGGFTGFHDSSTAGSAVIINNGTTGSGGIEGDLVFFDASTADNAVITNNGGTVSGGFGGFTNFVDSSTAGNAAITNNGSAFSGGSGSTEFDDTSTAGTASITNNGSTVSGGGGGLTEFFDNSTAGSATITTNGGTGGGLGGTTLFAASSDGGTARAITNGNGSFDISGLTTAGMGIGSIEGSGNYFLGSKTLTVGGNNLSTTVSGVIQDGGSSGGAGGSLTKIGTGTLTLTGKNTYTGTTTINVGSLIIDGSIASQQTIVNAGGFLGGLGIIGGNLSNSGIVGPGDSPGTLTVTKDYTQNATGTLRIEVGGLAANQHDLLAVNGHVTLGGTLQLVRINGFNLQPGNQIVFLTAQNGISGAFNTIQNDFTTTGTLVQAVVVTSPSDLVLEGQQGSFIIPGLTPNQFAVGKMLNSAVGNPAAAPLIAFLDSQPVANLPHDYDLIAPTQISSVNATAVSVGRVQATNLGGRTANVRGGSTGFSSAGFGISGGAASFGEGFAGVSGPEGKGGPPVFAPTPGNRWGVFLTGLGEFTNVDSTPNAPGYDVNTGGFTLGIDYRLTPNFALGLSAGYAHTSVSVDSAGGNIDVNAGTIGMYATVFGNGFYLDAAVNGGPSGYTTHRTALQGAANGSTNGGDLNGLVAGGYDWKKGNLTIEPTASFQYGYVALQGFTETGSLAPLTFPRQNTESERTAVGAKASYEWKIGNITAIPQFSAAWQHEFGDTAYAVVANLASGAGNSFTIHGPEIGRDSLLIGAGATVILNERVSAYLYYDGEFARTNYLANDVSGGVRISF